MGGTRATFSDLSMAQGRVWCRIQAHSPCRARPRRRPSAEPQGRWCRPTRST